MFSKNLKFYRLRAQMTRKALAEACGVSPLAITHYEAGDLKPGMDTLLAITGVLNISLADLLRRRNPLVFEHGDNCYASVMSDTAQEFVRESVEEYLGRFFDVLECLGTDVLPAAPACGRLPLTCDAVVDAAALRRHLGVGPVGPVPNLVRLLESRGILCVELTEVDHRFSGINGFVNGRPYVAVNASMSPERKRLTIVCEIARLMFDWEGTEGKEQERLATAIGDAFLLPAGDAIHQLGAHRCAVTHDMEMVAREYGASMMLLAKRAHLAGIISDSVYRSFCINANKAGWRTDEPSRIRPERPELFRQLVFQAVCEDDMSIQRGAELLGLSFDEVAHECELCGA